MSKASKYGALSRNTILFTISGFGSKIISFLFIPLYTWVLSTEEYGTIDLLTATVSLLIPVLTLNIQDAVLRFGLDKEYKIDDVISIGLKVNIFGSAVLFAALFIIRALGILNISDNYIIFLFFSYMLGGLNNCLTMYLKAENKVNVLVAGSLINTFIICAMNIVFLLIFKWGVNGYLLANIVGILLSDVYMFLCGKVYKNFRASRRNKPLGKEMIGYSLPLVFNSVAWWINNASDRYVVTFFCGMAVNGVFAVAYKIPTILSTFQSVFYNAWSISAITEFDEEDTDGFIGDTYTAYSCLSVFVCSIIMIFNILFARLLYANDFFDAWIYVPFLLVGTVFNGIALFEGCIFTAVKKTKTVSKTTIAGAITNAVLNVILIYSIGSVGAAIATFGGYFVTWVSRTVSLTKIIKMKIRWRKRIIDYVLLIIQAVIALNRGYEWIQVIILILIILNEYRFLLRIFSGIKEKIL